MNKKVKVVDATELKKQALAKFYSQISTAQDNQDWASMYELVPQSLRNYLTREQYISYQKSLIGGQRRGFSVSQQKFIDLTQNTLVNSIEVNGDIGIVDRTIITCSTKECIGIDRKEDNAKKSFIYTNGKWQIQDPQATSKALEVASYMYTNTSESDKKYLKDNFGYGTSSAPFITKNYALFLDQNPEELALVEAWIDKNKADRSRPVVNYQPPAVIQQPVFPNHCTSNTIGNYTYTNCY